MTVHSLLSQSSMTQKTTENAVQIATGALFPYHVKLKESIQSQEQLSLNHSMVPETLAFLQALFPSLDQYGRKI